MNLGQDKIRECIKMCSHCSIRGAGSGKEGKEGTMERRKQEKILSQVNALGKAVPALYLSLYILHFHPSHWPWQAAMGKHLFHSQTH